MIANQLECAVERRALELSLLAEHRGQFGVILDSQHDRQRDNSG